MQFELGIFVFWFVLTFGVLLALAWLAGWHIGSAPARKNDRRNGKQAGLAAVELLAAVAGIAGAVILAIPRADPALGFAAFLVSNVGWLAFSAARRHWGMFSQQVAFLVISLVGLWNWWLGPLVLGGQP